MMLFAFGQRFDLRHLSRLAQFLQYFSPVEGLSADMLIAKRVEPFSEVVGAGRFVSVLTGTFGIYLQLEILALVSKRKCECGPPR